MNTTIKDITGRDFSKKTLKALAASGLSITDVQFVPGADGSYANGERAYMLSNGCLRSHGEILKLAEKSSKCCYCAETVRKGGLDMGYETEAGARVYAHKACHKTMGA